MSDPEQLTKLLEKVTDRLDVLAQHVTYLADTQNQNSGVLLDFRKVLLAQGLKVPTFTLPKASTIGQSQVQAEEHGQDDLFEDEDDDDAESSSPVDGPFLASTNSLSKTQLALFRRFDAHRPSQKPSSMEVKLTLSQLRFSREELTSARNKAEMDRLITLLRCLYFNGVDAAAARILASMVQLQALESSAACADKATERFIDMELSSSNVDIPALMTSIIEERKKTTAAKKPPPAQQSKPKGNGGQNNYKGHQQGNGKQQSAAPPKSD